MKKKIELKQEDMKEIDFTKIKNVNFVEYDNIKNKLVIEFEMMEEKNEVARVI